MSKSLGNVSRSREVAARAVGGEALRLLVLGTHYRGPLDFSASACSRRRERALDRLYETLARADEAAGGGARRRAATARWPEPCTAVRDRLLRGDGRRSQRRAKAMGLVFDRMRDLNRALDAGDRPEAAAVRAELARVGVRTRPHDGRTGRPAARAARARRRPRRDRRGRHRGRHRGPQRRARAARLRRGRRHPGPAPRAGHRARGRPGRHDLEGWGSAGGQPETRLGHASKGGDALGTGRAVASAQLSPSRSPSWAWARWAGHEPGAPVRDFHATFTDVDGVHVSADHVNCGGGTTLEGDLGRGPPARAVREHRSHRRGP